MQSNGVIRIADLKYESDKMQKDSEIFKLSNEFRIKCFTYLRKMSVLLSNTSMLPYLIYS